MPGFVCVSAFSCPVVGLSTKRNRFRNRNFISTLRFQLSNNTVFLDDRPSIGRSKRIPIYISIIQTEFQFLIKFGFFSFSGCFVRSVSLEFSFLFVFSFRAASWLNFFINKNCSLIKYMWSTQVSVPYMMGCAELLGNILKTALRLGLLFVAQW